MSETEDRIQMKLQLDLQLFSGEKTEKATPKSDRIHEKGASRKKHGVIRCLDSPVYIFDHDDV